MKTRAEAVWEPAVRHAKSTNKMKRLTIVESTWFGLNRQNKISYAVRRQAFSMLGALGSMLLVKSRYGKALTALNGYWVGSWRSTRYWKGEFQRNGFAIFLRTDH